jgi:hypothetical protein
VQLTNVSYPFHSHVLFLHHRSLLLVVLRGDNAILFNLTLVHIAQRRHHVESGSGGRGSEALDDVVLVGDDT